ncbi:MAG: Rieske (2Fe-2S) protein, partial [Acidimicrobiales bacterium]
MNRTPTDDSAAATTTAVVGTLDDFAVGEMKLARVGERRIAIVRTPSGIHALDNACPHQGYGLVTGALDGELVTCQWHNWKFRVGDGRCVVGQENVACHAVHVEEGQVSVTVTEPTAAEARTLLWPSLRRGFERDYVGQMARDTARLLRAQATPEDIIWEGIEISSPRGEYGIGHGMAMAADCLTISDLYDGDDKTLPIVQALSGLSEPSRDRAPWDLPTGDATIDLNGAIETEDVDAALASTVGQLEAGATAEEMRTQLIDAVSRHHIG